MFTPYCYHCHCPDLHQALVVLLPNIVFFLFSRELQRDTAIMEEIFWKIIMIFQVLVHAKHFVSFSLDANTLFIMQKKKIANFFHHQAELAI